MIRAHTYEAAKGPIAPYGRLGHLRKSRLKILPNSCPLLRADRDFLYGEGEDMRTVEREPLRREPLARN